MSSSPVHRCFHVTEICKSCQWEVLRKKQLIHACAKWVVMSLGLKLREDAHETKATFYMLFFRILCQKILCFSKITGSNQLDSTTGLISLFFSVFFFFNWAHFYCYDKVPERNDLKGQMVHFGSWFQKIICLLIYLPRWDRALWWGECGRVMWLTSHWMKEKEGERGKEWER